MDDKDKLKDVDYTDPKWWDLDIIGDIDNEK